MFTWQDKLKSFFDTRATEVAAKPTLEDLCHISGREARLWRDPAIRDDLCRSILEQAKVGTGSKVLEVGCAAGFLAAIVAPRVGAYAGVDLASEPLQVARRLGLVNATFKHTDGATLPFPAGSFDAVLCYDVFTNLPSFKDGEPLIESMLRVVKPGGRVFIGSIPDRAEAERFQVRVAEVLKELDAKYGSAQPRPVVASDEVSPVEPKTAPKVGWTERLRHFLGLSPSVNDEGRPLEPTPAAPPEIICYEFDRSDFLNLGRRLGLAVEVLDIHEMNPYRGFRFNAVFTRPGQ